MKESKRENLNQKIALKMKSISQRVVLLMLNLHPSENHPNMRLLFTIVYIFGNRRPNIKNKRYDMK